MRKQKKLTAEIPEVYKTPTISISLNISPVYYDVEEHKYWLGNKQLKGITGFIGRRLFPDKYANIPKRILMNAASKGSKIHDDCDVADFLGQINSPEAQAYLTERKKQGYDFLASEYIVSDEMYFATPIDKVLCKDGKVYLADIKTTAKRDKDYVAWQLSICKYFFNMLNPDIEVAGLIAIWIRDGKVEFEEVKEKSLEQVISLLEAEINGEEVDIISNSTAQNNAELPLDVTQALTLVAEIESVITAKKAEIERVEEEKAELLSKIETAFRSSGIKSWETENMKISLVDSTEKRTFETKRFAEENPDMAERYYKTSVTKGYVKITLRNK